jgi:DNA-binding NarL/FixJ family response regulator
MSATAVEASCPYALAPMPNLKTFLVEDSPVIRSNLVAALEDLAPVEVVGYAESANDAAAQLEELESAGSCDLAIVDIFLKSGSGLDVLRRLREQGSAMRRVVLTNYASATMRAECLALGASKVFDKSRDIEALVSYCNEIAAA